MEMNSPAPPCTQDHICWGAHASHPDRHRLEVDSLSVYYGSLLALYGTQDKSWLGLRIS